MMEHETFSHWENKVKYYIDAASSAEKTIMVI